MIFYGIIKKLIRKESYNDEKCNKCHKIVKD